MSNPAYQNYLAELQNFVTAIGQASSQEKSDLYSGPRDSNGKPNGFGKMIEADESVYDGQFLHGLKNGNGIQTWPNGERYEGDWTDGEITGKGIKTWPSGDRYEGDWKDGNMHGKGIYNWPNGDKYDGEWKDDKMEGKGIKTWPDGGKYDGEWKNGVSEGKGIYNWPNGDKYDGEWKDDKMDGNGILTFANGKKQPGIWKGVIRVTGEFVWNNHPGFTFLFEPAFGQENILIAKCKKIGSERFYTYDQIVFENVEIKSDLSIKGKVLVPGPGWQDFEGTVANNQTVIYIGEPRWHWSFKKID